ncbi:hypothetical protein FPQ18DRAFT_307931 [Pyronema domesticum]|uniref:F-box domain-containing protein n=1 Tax=Pyronema omphalodes (strain CBS 100304) TaxID=1076935 RepID=U4L993_PYROM|nr:hypothetical protein FPQ18DRAFT_307931 [Pyronema domesticum]CCX10136.1 Similar to hypothetical protein MYCGRDRAFT_95595 [Mycosphaerella graminicola IPO323]; acc. no. EGP84296 [Pyronema omphalodes CBS 100304]
MLQEIPLEVLNLIFGHLSPVSLDTKLHPFLDLSITSHALLRAVETYCHHLLTSFKFDFLGNPPYRTSYLRYGISHCRFCHIPTNRHATIIPSIPCCVKCDKQQWPEKIMMELATKMYGLNGRELLEKFKGEKVTRSWGITWIFDEREIKEWVKREHGDVEEFKNRRVRAWNREIEKAGTEVSEARASRPSLLGDVFRELHERNVDPEEEE